MPITDRTPTLFFATFLFFAMTAISHAQQWNGPANPKGTIWRPGNMAIGEQRPRGDDPRAMVEVTRPLATSSDRTTAYSARIWSTRATRAEI